jgi:hypothetical protein
LREQLRRRLLTALSPDDQTACHRLDAHGKRLDHAAHRARVVGLDQHLDRTGRTDEVAGPTHEDRRPVRQHEHLAERLGHIGAPGGHDERLGRRLPGQVLQQPWQRPGIHPVKVAVDHGQGLFAEQARQHRGGRPLTGREVVEGLVPGLPEPDCGQRGARVPSRATGHPRRPSTGRSEPS